MATEPRIRALVFGAGGHARVIADAIALAGTTDFVAAVTDLADQVGGTLDGLPVHAADSALAALRADGVTHAIIAIGNARARADIAQRVEAAGLTLLTAVHPGACVSPHATIGAGSFLGAGSVVHAGTTIGAGAIVNTGAIVEHDCEIGAWTHIAPRAVVGGHARIGDFAWIGIGATVRDRMTVGAGTMVGAGAVVVRDLPGDVVAYGNPARVQPPANP